MKYIVSYKSKSGKIFRNIFSSIEDVDLGAYEFYISRGLINSLRIEVVAN